MFGYYLRDSLRSMRRNPALTTLVAAAIAVGIGVSITMLTIYHLMARNPIPEKSDVLYAVQLDSWNPIRPFDQDKPERAPTQVTWRDAQALLADHKAKNEAAMFVARLVIEPDGEQQLPFEVSARVTSGDFFPMFDVPFLYGSGWDRRADKDASQVIVLTRAINDKLFGGENSVGKKLTVNDHRFTVVGVMDKWDPLPRFFDVVEGPLNNVSDVFIPLSLTRPMKINSAGSDYGWKAEDIKTFDDWLNSESVWLQYWAELDTPAARDAYHAHLDAYAMEQKKLGRFQRPLNNQLHDVMDWMAYNEVVVNDVRVLVGLGFLFLLVCLLSSISLLLTKFNGRTAEMALRRALGANRMHIIGQNLVEVGMIGAIGGLVGIGFTWLSLHGIKAGLSAAPAGLFRMDPVMIGAALSIAVVTALLAGLYPAIKVCTITPAHELKTQ